MATLTTVERDWLRQRCASLCSPQTWTKPQINQALQTLEDDWATFLNRASTDIEAAAPGVFSLAAKKAVLRAFLEQKVLRGV